MKKEKSISPSIRVSPENLPPSISMSLAIKATTITANKLNGISFQTVPLFTDKGKMTAETPRISKMFAILLPKILPMAMSVFPWMLAIMLTINSGADVPNATMVSPITKDEMPNFLATEEAPSTKKLAPLIRKTKPTAIKTYGIISNIFFYFNNYKFFN